MALYELVRETHKDYTYARSTSKGLFVKIPRVRAFARVVPVFCIVLRGLIACSHAPAPAVSSAGAVEPNEVEKLYQAGMSDLADGLYPEAIKIFGDIKTKFPYSEFAALADLRTADANFKREKHLEAIDAYRMFLKYHPHHPEAAYASFQIAESYWEQIPSDWWFLPPSAEKDQQSTDLAISAYNDVVALYPKSEFAQKSTARITEARRKLANHEIYVARFYFKRENYRAAVNRAEGLLHDYASVGLDPPALLILAKSKLKLRDVEGAREALTRLAGEFPTTDEAGQARKLLEHH